MPQPNQYVQVLLDAKTTGAAITNLAPYNYVKLFLQGSGAITTGSIVVMESRNQGITGATLATITGADLTTGAQQTIALTASAFAWLIVQITPALGGGGTVTAEVRAN